MQKQDECQKKRPAATADSRKSNKSFSFVGKENNQNYVAAVPSLKKYVSLS